MLGERLGTVVTLSGQVGGAKLADGSGACAARTFSPFRQYRDDHEVFGLAFSPDIGHHLYTLAGVASPGAGLGAGGRNYALHDMLHRLGSNTVRVGDRCLRAAAVRTEGLRESIRSARLPWAFARDWA